MNAVLDRRPLDTAATQAAITSACDRIAPTWPLDQFIAVNPYWGWTDHSFAEAASSLTRLTGSSLWMPRPYYREQWRAGQIGLDHLNKAIAELSPQMVPIELIEWLENDYKSDRVQQLLSDFIDSRRDLEREPSWREVLTQQISQFCAAHFDTTQADWHPSTAGGLYASWRSGMGADHSISLLMDAPAVAKRARQLPADPQQLIQQGLVTLGIQAADAADFLVSLLYRINGWAAWCSYLRWQARLEASDDHQIVELLAIRLAWELLLDDGERGADSVWTRWRVAARRQGHPVKVDGHALWQRAHEIAYQSNLCAMLQRAVPPQPVTLPAVQAFFCIDVRSEVFRRALEQAAPDTQTLGFAGFFGLPISYSPIATGTQRPQLPGLLAPALQVSDTSGDVATDAAVTTSRQRRLGADQSWQTFLRQPGSAFTLVESVGFGYLGKILSRSLPLARTPEHPDHAGLSAEETSRLRPRLLIDDSAVADKAALAGKVLQAMSLTKDFARIILLAGHGSQSANNAHAAGLDCGACCGQTGEVNARALADLLNDASVRKALAEGGLSIPETSLFVAALHNTTTDEVTLFDTADAPASHRADLERLRAALAKAGERARAERAPDLGLDELKEQPDALLQAVRVRASDWAQTRPEWGLANCAAFIVGPRARTRGVNLDGRSFLHDYDWRGDVDGSVIELIMTAPMIVTHWINMQYYASTVDNRRFGSGNKVLHNVVGGRIGVFEGNAGDLRIGLPMQSLHDGQRWMHTPLRLSVFIAAPRAMIDTVIAKHEIVRRLLDNRWIHLFRLEENGTGIESYRQEQWTPVARPPEDIHG